MENERICVLCECTLENDDDCVEVEDSIVCSDCSCEECTVCQCCGRRVFNVNATADEHICVCDSCYERCYTRCEQCSRIIHSDDVYGDEDEEYCADCYSRQNQAIREYGYKPRPVFYGSGSRFFGVELEIDYGGRDEDNAEALLEIANRHHKHIYIKSDGSLDDGMEIVTHPMSLVYHLEEFPWEDLLHQAVHMEYRSHQTSTCGLHIHVDRTSLGTNQAIQEETISRILYFVEAHWNEMLRFSRRSEANMNRWAARYGYEHQPKAILDKAKSAYGRYTAVNLCNEHTIEFRMFRGTLRRNTLFATLQLVEHICNAALYLSDEEIKGLSWSDFVSHINETELIQYLKERRLYINEEIKTEEEL